jgi:YidC/Oxa1 family membrane protein insertase
MEAIPNTWQTWAVDPLSDALTLIQDVVGSYAIAIVLFTVLIRLLMIPLTLQQITSQRKMQLIQPELEKIRNRFKGDRQAVSEATMKLYKERGVKPMASCLPIFIQLPVLLALYGGILTLSSRGLLNEQFLWFNLAREDSTIQVIGDAAPTEPVDVVIATTELPTPLESSLAVSFTQFAANYQFRTDVVDAEGAIALLNDGTAAAIFLDNKADVSQMPSGTEESRLVQAAAFLVERDRPVTRLTVNEVEGILRGRITNWADLGAGVGPIVLHGLKDDLSAPTLLERVVLDGDPIQVPIREHNSVDDYFDALRAEPGSLGVSPPMRTDDVRMLNIEAHGADRAYPALADALEDGRYALARDVFAYWGPATDSTKAYLRDWWNSGQGQEAAQVAGFTRLPAQFDLFASGGFYISVLALLAGAFQFVQARMMQSSTATGQAATMNRVMQFMPIIVVVFAWTFQAGLVVYWVISSIIAIVQQYFTTGTGKLIPAHWPIARDVMGEHRAKVEEATAKAQEAEAKPETPTRSRRRRRRRRRGG